MSVLRHADCLRAVLAACYQAEAESIYVIDYTIIIDYVNDYFVCDSSKLSCAVIERTR